MAHNCCRMVERSEAHSATGQRMSAIGADRRRGTVLASAKTLDYCFQTPVRISSHWM